MPSAGAGPSATTQLLLVNALENFEDFVAKPFMMHLPLKSLKNEMSFLIQKFIK